VEKGGEGKKKKRCPAGCRKNNYLKLRVVEKRGDQKAVGGKRGRALEKAPSWHHHANKRLISRKPPYRNTYNAKEKVSVATG